MKIRSLLPQVWVVIAVALQLLSLSARAHTQSTAYLTLQDTPAGLAGEWHLALRDLEDAVGLDLDDNGAITWAELLSRQEAVTAYALSRLHFRCDDQPTPWQVTGLLVDQHADGAYAVLRFTLAGAPHPRAVELTYRAFFDLDPKHRGLLRLEQGGVNRLAVFAPEAPTQTFALNTPPVTSPLGTFFREGVWHIWSGYDHLLFLLALLLPGVLRRRAGVWQPVTDARAAFLNVLKIISAFTPAHSLTLSCAALGLIHLPTRLVESAIAASVILAAVNNLVPAWSERSWLMAFGFGLLHGFGFANALRDLGLHPGQLAITLFGFNLGVEIGQLAIVAVFLPLALSARHWRAYPALVLRTGSVAILAVAAVWFAERVGDFKWLPF